MAKDMAGDEIKQNDLLMLSGEASALSEDTVTVLLATGIHIVMPSRYTLLAGGDLSPVATGLNRGTKAAPEPPPCAPLKAGDVVYVHGRIETISTEVTLMLAEQKIDGVHTHIAVPKSCVTRPASAVGEFAVGDPVAAVGTIKSIAGQEPEDAVTLSVGGTVTLSLCVGQLSRPDEGGGLWDE